jgi:alpha-ketoglutarate-dependent taurine dioxygenase
MFTEINKISSIIDHFFSKGFVHISNNKPVPLEELKNICELFGKIHEYKKERITKSQKLTNIDNNYSFIKDKIFVDISSKGMFGENELNWHKDMMLVKPWFPGSLLYAETDSDTPTNFCYTLNTSLENKVYEHSCFSTNLGFDKPSKEKEYAKRFRDNPKLAQRVGKFVDNYLDKKYVQPTEYIVNHPVTNEKCVLTSPATMAKLHEEYELLVNDMLENNDSFSHNWKKFDIVIWDNYKLMHHRAKVTDKTRKLIRLNFNYDNV